MCRIVLTCNLFVLGRVWGEHLHSLNSQTSEIAAWQMSSSALETRVAVNAGSCLLPIVDTIDYSMGVEKSQGPNQLGK